MEGLATPSGQFAPKGVFGWHPNLPPEKYDPAGAKKLLSEAGYPDGFCLTVHGPSDRYINDGKIIQTVGQMFAQIGLDVKVDAMPKAVYFPKAAPPKGEFSIGLLGQLSLPDAPNAQVVMYHTYSKEKATGSYNFGLYSNPGYDNTVDECLKIADPAKREKCTQEATEILVKDVGFIPLHWQHTVVATRKGLNYLPRVDEGTYAMNTK
jgi:peptide/nickel transport system substrate-binding protein